jgi:hypothetical protein
VAYVTAKQIANVAVPLLSRALVLPNTVLRIPGGAYDGPNGGTVALRVRDYLAAREQVTPGTQITWDSLSEVIVNVAVEHIYSATKVTDEDMTLSIVDFGLQVIDPQAEGVARRAEDNLATVMNDLAADASFDATASAADTEARILEARQALTEADVPAGDRFFAVSPDIATRILKVPNFVRVDESGSDQALRNAVIGKLYGFTFVESNALTPGTAVAYHRSGFAWANFKPKGAPNGGNTVPGADIMDASLNGISIRAALQWLPDFLSTGSVLQTFVGSNIVDADRVYKFDTASS